MLGFWIAAPRDCTESVYNNTRVRRQFSERMGGNGVGIAGAGGITGAKRRLIATEGLSPGFAGRFIRAKARWLVHCGKVWDDSNARRKFSARTFY